MIDLPPTSTLPSSNQKHVFFAGGGTGGHLYPALAIAEQLHLHTPETTITFLCADKALDAEILGKANVRFRPMPARPFGIRPFPKSLLRFVGGWHKSVKLAGQNLDHALQECGASQNITVVLMGGYVAAPVAKAAAQRDIRVLLVNLDVVPGKANRLAARWADEMVSAVRCPSPPAPPRFSEARVVGMPIRSPAIASGTAQENRAKLGLNPDLKTLLITGASQGAGTFNDLVATMVGHQDYRAAFEGWQVLHLAGPDREAGLRATYEANNLPALVLPYCHNMGAAWGAADLALSRAGASSVAEAAMNHVPTIFAPYPYHADEHQKFNAEPIVELGGGWLVADGITVEANLSTIGKILKLLLIDPDRRSSATQALQNTDWPNAATTIAELMLPV